MPGEPALPGELTGDAGAGALASGNGANAPADNPEDAETLPALGLRPDLPRRAGEAPAGDVAAAGGEAAAGEAVAVEADAPAPGEGSRGTPGMSQPGSVMVASLRLRDTSTSTDHVFDNIASC